MAKKTRSSRRSRPVGRKAGKKKGSVRRRIAERRGKSGNVSSRRRATAKTRAARTAKRRGGAKKTAKPGPKARPAGRPVSGKRSSNAASKKSGKSGKRGKSAKSGVRARAASAARAKAARPAARRRSSGTADTSTRAAKVAAPRKGQKRPPALDRERRRLADVGEDVGTDVGKDIVPTPPSSLDMDRSASAARSGRREMQAHIRQHNESGPALTGGDVDATWETAYSTGDEAPGGDNPTPDQDRVDDIGKSLGVQYEDNEELKASDKITERDRHRWELDPASSEDYKDRTKP